MKRLSKFIATTLSTLMLAGVLSGCGNSGGNTNTPPPNENSTAKSADKNKDYDFYIFNTKGENADALQAAVNAYEAEKGVTVKVFSLGSGTNSSDTLRAEMNSKKMPALFSIMNIQELVEWEEGGFALDLNTATNEEFKKLHDSVPQTFRLTSDGTNSFGIPYNVEGYGYIVNTKMLEDLFGADKVEGFLKDFKTATYDEFEQMVNILDTYIKDGTAGTVKLSGNDYALVATKTDLTNNLNGVFAVAGSEKWTYGDHFINIAINAVFDNPSAADNATEQQIDSLKGPFVAYAKALDLKTSHVAGMNGALPRSPEFINSTTNGYDQSVANFASGKSIFIKQGNWAYANIEKANSEIVDTLTFLPIKMPFNDSDIQVNGLTVDKMNQSISVYVPNYYAINAKASQEEQEMAEDFLVWLNTTEQGQKFVTEDMAFIPYNADPATTNLPNSLGNSIIGYMKDGNTISNPYSGAPINWSGETVGLKIMEEYLIKPEWTEEDYNAIADYGISTWKEMKSN